MARRVAGLFAFLALAIQCLIVQPHIDAASMARAVNSGAAHTARAATARPVTQVAQQDADSALACVICQEALGSRASLTAAVKVTPLIPRTAQVERLASDTLATWPTRSHAWRSRAPPLSV